MVNKMKKMKGILAVMLAAMMFTGTIFTSCNLIKSPDSTGTSGETGTTNPDPINPDPTNPDPTKPDPTNPDPTNPDSPVENEYPTELFVSDIYSVSKVGCTAEYLGTTERRIPEISDGGLERYPQYGITLSGATADEKNAILAENSQICASASTYDSMDAEGNLYLNGEATGKKLYKHTASVGLYEGNLSDEEPAIIKKITMQSRSTGNHLTGLYAPAGEVVKIEMSEADFAKTGGLTVHIGQVLQNKQANNIWAARNFNRMPVIVNTMTTKNASSYVGSYLGGPIYIQPVNAGVKFTVTISGAVPYSHYIHGYTTVDEFEFNSQSTAPYFDLEVWDDAVRHSGPKARAADFDYKQLTEAAVLWDKISRVSNQVPSGSTGSIGITFLYDPFVAAGSMVAFVGRSTVNCPLYCMTAALDAESAVNNSSDAFWGCIHEYNHHYQRFGFAPGDEVTNNAVSLVSYSLFTRNSSNRQLGNANEGNYATGWDRYTNPSWTLKQTLANSGVNSNLDSYANLLHTFGQDRFLQATVNGNGGGGADTWYKAVSNATNYDMTYYFTEVLHQTVSQNLLDEYKAKNYPMFVPVATIYQTGRSYSVGGHRYYSQTAQPYGIEKGSDFEINLKTNLVIPSGFTWSVKKITQPTYGTLTQESDGVYIYTPDGVNRESGKIYVTLEIIKDDGAFEVEDVEIVIELREKQYNPSMLERTVYTYTNETMYSSAVEAVENGYAGYETKIDGDNVNPTQNANTDIWAPNPTQNAIMEVRGKFYISANGKYRIAIRGRRYAALYISLDGENYELAANMANTTNSPQFDLTNPNNYKDYELKKGQWVYFKEVLLVTYNSSFVGLGMGRFNGDTVNVAYANAYRTSYYKEKFESEYYYPRDYKYTYSQTSGKQTLVEAKYQPWDASYSIDRLFDNNDTNFIHSNKTNISEDNPFEVVADLGKTMRANRFTIYGEPSRQYQPKKFELYGGTELDNMQLIASVENSERINNNVIVNFEEREIRYYKLKVTDTWASGTKYIAYRCAKFSYTLDNGSWLSPDEEMFVYRGGWKLGNAISTFGHLYEGENATLDFEFTGNRFAIFSYMSPEYDSFEVLVDGELIVTVSLNVDGEEGTALAYLSQSLPEGNHKVTIRSKTKFNIDSLVLWQ